MSLIRICGANLAGVTKKQPTLPIAAMISYRDSFEKCRQFTDLKFADKNLNVIFCTPHICAVLNLY